MLLLSGKERASGGVRPCYRIDTKTLFHTMGYLVYTVKLVGCPCVVTSYNNIHVNYPLNKFQDFVLIVFTFCIIFFDLAN